MRLWLNDKVLSGEGFAFHQLITRETGGSNGVRDLGLLDSALESAYSMFDGVELYPTKEEKGARLGLALISNHAFADGNKRIGMYVLLTFLEVNGIHMNPSSAEVERVGSAVASGQMKLPGASAMGA